MQNPNEYSSCILSDGDRDLIESESTQPGSAEKMLPVIANRLAGRWGTAAKARQAHRLLLDGAAASAVRIMADKDFAPSFRIMAAR